MSVDIPLDDGTYFDDGTGFVDGFRVISPLAITNRNELRSAIAAWMARPDLNSQIDDFIGITEAQFNRQLRLRTMEVAGDLAINAETVPLPSGFRGVRRLFLDKNPRVFLKYLSPEQFYEGRRSTATGEPKFFTILTEDFHFSPSPDAEYTGKLIYWQGFTPLAANNTTNTMLTLHPDLYLFGALLSAEEFFHNDPRIAYWRDRYAQILQEIMREDQMDKRSGSVLSARPNTSEMSLSR